MYLAHQQTFDGQDEQLRYLHVLANSRIELGVAKHCQSIISV